MEDYPVIIAEPQGAPWQNPQSRFDVNHDGNEDPNVADLLAMVQFLRGYTGPLEPPLAPPSAYVDVDGDNQAGVADLLELVQEIRAQTVLASSTAVAEQAEGEDHVFSQTSPGSSELDPLLEC